MPTTIQLPAGTEWVTVRSIPKLFAIALHGEPPSGNEMTAADMVWHGAVIEVEETIKRAVMQDELMPRNALSRRPMPDVRGEALHDAIVTVADLAEFAAQFVVGVSVEAAQTGTTPALAKVGDGDTVTDEEDTDLAQLFDPVPVTALEKMFPSEGKWAGWAEHASRHPELKAARQGRAMFNPYLAGIWFARKGRSGWDLARCRRALANNLPDRSLDDKHRLTGGLE